MADNATVSTTGGNETIAADEVSSVKYQRIKLIHGIDGVNDGDVSRTNPFPVQAYLDASTMQSGSTQLTPGYSPISLTATGTIVAAVASKKIRVVCLAVQFDFTTNNETYTFYNGPSASGGVAITGTFVAATASLASPFLVLPFSPIGWFETSAGALLELALGGTTPIARGCLAYVTV